MTNMHQKNWHSSSGADLREIGGAEGAALEKKGENPIAAPQAPQVAYTGPLPVDPPPHPKKPTGFFGSSGQRAGKENASGERKSNGRNFMKATESGKEFF